MEGMNGEDAAGERNTRGAAVNIGIVRSDWHASDSPTSRTAIA